MTDVNHTLLKKVQELTEENKMLKEEVLFWQFFYCESIKLFGDKKDELKPMLKKIMSLIQLDCRAKAKDVLNDKEIIETKSGFNVDKFMEYCDKITQVAYSKKYPPSIHLEYLELIGYGEALAENRQDDITYKIKIAALETLQEKYKNGAKLSSFVKTLERYGVLNLPPIRTIENKEE